MKDTAIPTGRQSKAGRSMPEKKPRAKTQQRGDNTEASRRLGSLGHTTWSAHGGSALGFFRRFSSCEALASPRLKSHH